MRILVRLAGLLALALTSVVGVGLAGPAAGAVPPHKGYWLEAGDGGVFAFGAPFEGSAAADATRCPANPPGRTIPNGSCWSIAPTPGGDGYWILNSYNGPSTLTETPTSYGQPADTSAYSGGADTWPKAMEIVPTNDGKGYWVLDEGPSGLGSVQSFGDAVSYGDETTSRPRYLAHAGSPVAMAAAHDDKGYWIVDSDGGVFSFGDATFHGSMGNRRSTHRSWALL